MQKELLKLYSTNIPDEQLREISEFPNDTIMIVTSKSGSTIHIASMPLTITSLCIIVELLRLVMT